MKAAFLAAAAFGLLALPARAQVSDSGQGGPLVTFNTSSTSRIGAFDDPTSARDGCVNVPGQAHNSSDCAPIYWMDPNTVLPDKPFRELTGAEENLLRSANILLRGRPPSRAAAPPAPGAAAR
jgi:hypothetical protein